MSKLAFKMRPRPRPKATASEALREGLGIIMFCLTFAAFAGIVMLLIAEHGR